MTIVTRRVQQRGDWQRRRVGGRDIVPRQDRRICARRIRELQQGEHHDKRANNPFQFFLHSTNRTRQQWEKFPPEANLNGAVLAERQPGANKCNEFMLDVSLSVNYALVMGNDWLHHAPDIILPAV